MEELKEYLPVLIPVIILQLALMIIAVVHVLKHRKYKFGNMAIWLVLVILIQYIGPILYFTVGRGEE